MTELVVALLMLVNGEIKEARIQPGYKKCLEGARKARRGLKIDGNIKYSCIKSMAELEENIDGIFVNKKINIKIKKLCNFQNTLL